MNMSLCILDPDRLNQLAEHSAGRQNYFAMQIRADRSKTLVDRMDHAQCGEVATRKENSDYQVVGD